MNISTLFKVSSLCPHDTTQNADKIVKIMRLHRIPIEMDVEILKPQAFR